jgi:hypothetical protein
MTRRKEKKPIGGSSGIGPGDYAIIITPDNEIEFLMPNLDEVEDSKPIPKLAIALIAVANLMENDLWVKQTIDKFFGSSDDEIDRVKITKKI